MSQGLKKALELNFNVKRAGGSRENQPSESIRPYPQLIAFEYLVVYAVRERLTGNGKLDLFCGLAMMKSVLFGIFPFCAMIETLCHIFHEYQAKVITPSVAKDDAKGRQNFVF